MSRSLSEISTSTTRNFKPTPDGWAAFRKGVMANPNKPPIMGRAGYHYQPPGASRIKAVAVGDSSVNAELEDGRKISIPLFWFPILRDATPEERGTLEFVFSDRRMVFFPLLNTEITVDQMLAYRDGMDEGAFIRASASKDGDMLMGDIAGLVRKAMDVTGKSEEEIWEAVKRKQPMPL